MKIESYYIEKLRQLPIEEVADALGMGLRKHNAICPFHNDSHPSLHFSTTHNNYHCYVCGAHGGTIDLVMHRENLKFHEACRWLADAFGVYIGEDASHGGKNCIGEKPSSAGTSSSSGIFSSAVVSSSLGISSSENPSKLAFVDTEYLGLYVARPVLNAEAEHFLFEERRLNRAIIDWCHVSSISQSAPCTRFGKPFYDAPSLLIPYFDRDGRLLSVQSRYLSKSQGVARFKFPKGSQCHVYNLPILRWLKPDEELFITEGCTDCWAMMSSGRKAIAIPSATLLKIEDIEPLKALNLHIFPDQDEPGERLYLELKDRLPQLERHQLPEDCKDFSEYYLRYMVT